MQNLVNKLNKETVKDYEISQVYIVNGELHTVSNYPIDQELESEILRQLGK